jgi:hypothetical protein
MTPGNDSSVFEDILQGLMKALSPAEKALRLQKELNVQALEETAGAAERVGCEVCHVDLPEKVSGFADIIEGKPHIVLNRAKSQQNLAYTLAHELGHQVLHLSPSRDASELRSLIPGAAELEADLFAVTWVNWLGTDRQREEMFAESRESSAAVVVPLILVLAMVAVAILAWVCSEVFNAQRLALREA